MSTVEVYHGDSREMLKLLADDSIDAVVTDPPYALVSIGQRYGAPDAAETKHDVYARATAGFMGRTWDTGETAFAVEFWAEVWRVLKPGGHVVAFSGTRTYHRLACAIEDAGFEIRDMLADLISQDAQVQAFADSLTPAQASLFARLLHESSFGGMLAWIYGSGFPKSHDIAKSVDRFVGAKGGYGAPKSPDHAHWIERGELRGDGGGEGWQRPWMDDPEAVERSARRYLPGSAEAAEWDGWGTALKPALEPVAFARKPLVGNLARNVLAHGCGALNIDGCRIEAEGWAASGSPSGGDSVTAYGDGLNNAGRSSSHALGRWPANVLHDGSDEVLAAFPESDGARGAVTGEEPSSATGVTYNPRQRVASDEPRGDAGSAARFFYSAKAAAEDRLGSDHATVKPVALMAWLIRLVTPPGGTVLDPFAGSGTTGMAALVEGVDAILIEREADHAEDIRRRLAWARGDGRLTSQEMLSAKLRKDPDKARGADLPLFTGGK